MVSASAEQSLCSGVSEEKTITDTTAEEEEVSNEFQRILAKRKEEEKKEHASLAVIPKFFAPKVGAMVSTL